MTRLACAFLALFLSGCLYSVHHFNTGLLLPAGESQATLGVGRQSIYQGSLDYRLGLHDSMGPFPGAELQCHLEAPTRPATMEFAVNLALPSGPSFNHALGGGWGIGAWADNSLFAEYAVSGKVGLPRFFGNFRLTWLATQIDEVMRDDFSKALPRHQTLVAQAGMGLWLPLPPWKVVPDFLIPQINITAPQLSTGHGRIRSQDIPLLQWDMTLGFGWSI